MKSDYPEIKIENVSDELHGETLVDPYRWLESTSFHTDLCVIKKKGTMVIQHHHHQYLI